MKALWIINDFLLNAFLWLNPYFPTIVDQIILNHHFGS